MSIEKLREIDDALDVLRGMMAFYDVQPSLNSEVENIQSRLDSIIKEWEEQTPAEPTCLYEATENQAGFQLTNGWYALYPVDTKIYAYPPSCDKLVEALQRIADTAPDEGSHQYIALQALAAREQEQGK
jgi:hypothetical protein